MRHIRAGLVRFLSVIGAVAAVSVFVAVFSVTGHAAQSRTPSEGVYSGEQAKRGQQLYQAQCLACHGDTLQGLVGPMLTGESFMSAWNGRSLAELVEKIQKTMPPQAPGSFTQDQAIDVTAFILETGKFPSGSSGLSAAVLSQVTFPAARAATAAATGDVPLAAAANLAQLMRGVTFPLANLLFNTQIKDPGDEKPKPPIPFDYALWGRTVYYGWQAVGEAALSLQDTTPLFLLPGRRCENGRPVPVNKADFQKYVHDLVDVAKELHRASQSRNVDAVSSLAEKLNDACANCHKVYRDVGTSEGGGLGTDRCRP